MDRFDISLIDEVIKERSANWQDFTKENQKQIRCLGECVFQACEKMGIPFDQTAGITFMTHLTTLYERLFMSHEVIEIEDELYDQIDEELMFKSKDITLLIENVLNCVLDRSECFLIATHLGSMRERISQNN